MAMHPAMINALLVLLGTPALAADLPIPSKGMGPYSARLTAYSATDPQQKNKNGRNSRGSCGGNAEGPNESATGPKPLDHTYDGGSAKVMVATSALSQFKNCQLSIPGLGSNFYVMDHMPGGQGLSHLDISHADCAKMKNFGNRQVSGIYVINVGKDGCNPDRIAKKKAKRRKGRR